MAGHSLGEYTALVAANSLKLNVAAKLLKIRGQSMQKAVPIGHGSMAAIIGASIGQVENLIIEINSVYPENICDIANDNAPGQVVVSGHTVSIEKAIEIASQFGSRKAIKLPVSAPFHCSLMSKAAEEMMEAFSEITMQDPTTPIISNITAGIETSKEKIVELLIEQVTGRVRWTETILFAKDNNVNTIFEIGAGKVLSGLVRRIDGTLNTISIDDPSQIDNFKLN
jgi:[acyl-carrier-protein] S-malonyltransferase